MVQEVLRCRRGAARVEVMRRRRDDGSDVEQAARDQRRVIEMANADRDIHSFFDQVGAAIIQVEVESNPRMQLRKCRDRLAHVPHTERQRQRHAQRSPQLPVLLLHGRLRFVEVREYPRTVLVKAPARVSQVQHARSALQELDAETFLESGDAAAHRRLGRIQALGRCCEAAGLHNGHKGL